MEILDSDVLLCTRMTVPAPGSDLSCTLAGRGVAV